MTEQMDTLYFEGRNIKPYGEFASASGLVEGETYFAVHYVDDRMLIPEVTPLVFIGRDLDPADSGRLYFQDAGSYVAGARFGSAAGAKDAEFHTVAHETPFVFEFERALDVLLGCSLKRRRGLA